MTARVASEATMRQQLLDDVNASFEAALTDLKEANEAFAMRYGAQHKQNRLLLIGLAVLGTAQIVLQLI